MTTSPTRSSTSTAATTIRRRESDFDRDGRIDEIAYYTGGVIARKDRETNLDGKLDTWDFYEGGKIHHRMRDSDGDGRVDQWWTWPNPDRIECAVIAADHNRDGRPDPERRDRRLLRQRSGYGRGASADGGAHGARSFFVDGFGHAIGNGRGVTAATAPRRPRRLRGHGGRPRRRPSAALPAGGKSATRAQEGDEMNKGVLPRGSFDPGAGVGLRRGEQEPAHARPR